MRFDLVRPCPHCPFRTDCGGYLTPERAREIGEAVALRGQSFACHKTTVPDEWGEELTTGPNSQMCAGALIFAELSGAQPPQLARIAERTGTRDPDRLDCGSLVVESLGQLVELHGGELPEGECCSIAEMGCLAPAGYAMGGGVVEAVEREATVACVGCGEAVCEACSAARDDGRVCSWCEDPDA